MYPLSELKEKIGALGYRVENPPPEVAADLAIPAFKNDPNSVAEAIKKIDDSLIEAVSVKGRFVNLSLRKQLLGEKVLNQIIEEQKDYGRSTKGQGKKIIIEFSDPNVAKPLNVGHFRTTIIGQTLVNLYRWQGYEVISINHLGDWGTQFGKLLIAQERWGAEEKDLFRLYVRFHEEAEKNPELEEAAQKAFARLEKGDKDLFRIWEKITNESIAEFNKVYKELGISFDYIIGESFYREKAGAAVHEALAKGVADHSEGAIIVSETKTGLPTFVIQKKDEASIYAGRDLATAKDRLERWQPEKIIYVVGSEQNLYFKQLFKTFALLGYDPEKFVHVSLGIVILPEGKMSTRKGRVIFLSDLLKEVLEKTNNKTIGYGALIYNVLATSPERTVVFEWQKMLSTEGASAPYLQYGYVRTKSLLEKSGSLKKLVLPVDFSLDELEKKLILLLALFPDNCRLAQKQNAPNLLIHYLNTLVQEFNRFYVKNPVLNAAEPTKNLRLHLTAAVGQVIQNGLALLQIQVPEKM